MRARAGGAVALGDEVQQAGVAAQGGGDLIEALVHGGGVAPEGGIVGGDAQHVEGAGQGGGLVASGKASGADVLLQAEQHAAGGHGGEHAGAEFGGRAPRRA